MLYKERRRQSFSQPASKMGRSMFSAYLLVKFIHVAAAIVWVGGGLTMSLLNARLARVQDRQGTMVLDQQAEFFGKAVFGPSAIVTLLAGVGLVGLSGGHM